jgi:hypothetical protein
MRRRRHPRPDVDGGKALYEEAPGFRPRRGARSRVVQLTPPASACSIMIGRQFSQVTCLITCDIGATRAELVDRGVEMSEPSPFGPQG